VFQSNPEGQFEVYVIPTAGGKPLNLTLNAALDGRPSFSRDGHWIYFTSNRTGQLQLWKIPASGGDAVQVTNNGAFAAFESPDGTHLYYSQTMEMPSPFWRQPVSGGVLVKVLEGVVRSAFVVQDAFRFFPLPGVVIIERSAQPRVSKSSRRFSAYRRESRSLFQAGLELL
jgi:eukaryotic-like serine/threonine-protein kinase